MSGQPWPDRVGRAADARRAAADRRVLPEVAAVDRRDAAVEAVADDLAGRPRPPDRRVKPSFSKIVPAGADAPKWSSPMIAPSSPTQRSQPSETPTSTLTRLRTAGGRTSSRYAWSWRSKRSQHGRDTTRVGIPSPSSASAAANASWSSDPVPIRISCGFPPDRLAQDVAAAGDALAGSRSVPGKRRQLLARQRQGDRAVACRSTASAQAAAVSFASPGRMNHRFGIARSAA